MLKKTKAVIMVVVSIFTISVFMTSCNNDSLKIDIKIKNQVVSDFAELIKDGSPEQAITLYNESIKDEVDLINEAIQFISAYYEYIEKYVFSEQFDLETAEKMLNTVSKVQNEIVVDDVDQKTLNKNIKNCLSSKKAFDKGNENFENKEYAKAILEYRKVLEKDPNYKKALLKIDEVIAEYSNAIFSEIDLLIAEKRYLEAVSKIQEADYFLQDGINLQDKINICINSFVDIEIERANKAYHSESDANKALQIIKTAQKQFPDNEKLKEREDYYSSIAQ